MSDPPGEEKNHVCLREVGGLKARMRKKLPHVVQRHNDHDHASNDVDRFDASMFDCDSFAQGLPSAIV